MIYSFILGKNPNLSIAEITAVLSSFDIDFQVIYSGQEVFLIDSAQEIDFSVFITRLGGTIKIGRIISETEDTLDAGSLAELFGTTDKKVFFGFSFYNLTTGSARFSKIVKSGSRLGMELKKAFKNQNEVSSRWVSSKEDTLSSVIVAKNKLLTHGKELNFFIEQDKIYIGETIVVQDFEKYGERDFGRPNRDDKSGMLPPKLAQIMLNLSQVDPDDVVLDPFCGSGTVLQEAALMKYKNITGSDVSPRAIDDTKANLDWFSKHNPEQDIDANVFISDVKDISKKLDSNSVDAIVTEPYLGPPKFKIHQIDGIIKELTTLYIAAFGEFSKILKPGGRIIMTVPAWRVGDNVKHLPVLDQVEKLGFRQIEFSDNNIQKNQSRSGLIYQRESQKVVREIWGWEKKD